MRKLNRPIPESYWVEPGRFLAGEYPGYAGNEQLRRRIDSLLDSGIDTFIDLTDPEELPPYLPVLTEQARYYGTDIRHKRFSITDFGIPNPETMQAILDEIDSSLTAGHKIYLHCWGGIGRTGTTVGCYLVQHGLPGEQALAQLAEWWQEVPKSRVWPRTPETDRQVEFILNWENSPLPPGEGQGEG
jgi:Swiss Army Knife protein, DSP-PTPase phosphatase domain